MGNNNYERLSPQDLQFLVMESPGAPMDMVSTQVFGEGRLTDADGGVDIDFYRDLIESVLDRFPRFRQKLKWIPYADIPVWVDDANFNIEYHVRHTALPRPGSMEQLKNLVARITERALDRQRPLWEVWVVEGLEHHRYALISKIHHCMFDGIGKHSMMQIMMSENSEDGSVVKRPFVPSQPPSEVSLLWDEWHRRYAQPVDALRNAGELLRRTTGMSVLERRLGAVRDSLVSIVRRPRATPVNGELSSHRRVEWLELPLSMLDEAARLSAAERSDIVLALLAGGIRELYQEADAEPHHDFRLAMPLVLDAQSDSKRCSAWVVDLPIDEADVLERVERISDQASEWRAAGSSVSLELPINPMESIPAAFLSLFTTGKETCANTLLSYVAGPDRPLYSMGARMDAIYPHLPLLPGIGLTTALVTYRDKLCWGLNGDYDLIPDLGIAARGVVRAFEQLTHSLGIEPAAEEGVAPDPRVSWHKPERKPRSPGGLG